jgi:hypothetical protein
MPSGNEKSPDYGGPEPTWRVAAAVAVAVALVVLALFFLA